MYEPTGGKKVTVQGVEVYLPKQPPKSKILFNLLPKTEQYWKRTPLPTFRAVDITWFSEDEPENPLEEIEWEVARREEIIGQTGRDPWDLDSQKNPKVVKGIVGDTEYFEEVLEDFKAQELGRWRKGVWFYNNGVATYITGDYYFFLNWWKLDVGYPDYKDPDRELLYLVEFCDKSPDDFGVIYITSRGAGKDLEENTIIYKEEGPIKIKDVKVGDRIYGSDGKLTTVTQRFDYNDQLQYEVEFLDNRKVECGEGHLWTLYDHTGIKKTLELKEFKEDFQLGYVRSNGKKDSKYYNSLCSPIKFNEKNLPIDPYYLGLWLGDGTTRNTQITNPDQEIIDFIYKYASELGLIVGKMKTKGCPTHSIASERGQPNPLLNKLKDLKLIKNKHLPQMYLYSSVAQRMSLLQGLMDSDGYGGANGQIEFSSSNKDIADGMIFLLNSLGIKFNVKIKKPWFTYKGEKKLGKDSYIFRIRTGLDVFRLKRKKEKIIKSTNPNTIGRRTKVGIKSITRTSIKPSVCIAVDNEDKLFVVNDFVVTHNSVLAGCLAYSYTIKKKFAYTGIQSKTETDAQKFFLRKVVEAYKELPDFFIPINKNPSSPTSKLSFSAPSKSGKSAMANRKLDKDALRSEMDFAPSGEKAYDGETLNYLIQDEIGKTVEADVNERWNTNKQCLYRGYVKRGTAFLTTTVEEMSKGGGKNCYKIWDDSDNDDRENGRTKSWLVRYFRSADEGGRYDKFGIPDVRANRAWNEAERKRKLDDPKAYVSWIQKNPYNAKEAFAASSGNSPYNAAVLTAAQIKLMGDDHDLVVQGDFQWENNKKDTKVEFIRNDVNGMWEISWMDMKEGESNHVYPNGEVQDQNGKMMTIWGVKKNKFRRMGYDPYSAKKVVDESKKSDAAISVFQKSHDPMNIPEEYLDTFIAHFEGRYHNPNDAHEQAIMAAVFFGSEVLVESNKMGAINYIESRGYLDILMERPASTGTKDHYRGIIGMPSNQVTIDYYVGLTRAHINTHGHKLKHLRIVEHWLGFDPFDTTQFDSAVSASVSILASEAGVDVEDESEIYISELFTTTDQS